MDGMKDEWLRVFLDDRDQWGFIGNVAVEYHKKYIDYGYRTQKNVLRTASTLFTWHNETMNIWSHLIGFICAFVAISHYLHAEVIHGDGSNFLSSDQIKSMNTVEFLSCFSFYAAAATCFFFSSVYHWFQCMSPSCCKQLLSFDLAGIALLIGCSYFPAMYYAFECFPNLLNIYMCVSAGVTVVGLANQWLPVKYFGTFRPYIFAGLVLFGIVPLVHWALITPPAIRDELFLGEAKDIVSRYVSRQRAARHHDQYVE
jgi:predicted membrane channel-forming protein YqfA (hemolysin III family)